MQTTAYRSKIGEIKTKEQWLFWAVGFYENLLDESYKGLPTDWFERLTKILKLEEVCCNG